MAGRRVRLWGLDAPELAQTCTDARGASYPCGACAAPGSASSSGGQAMRGGWSRASRQAGAAGRPARRASGLRCQVHGPVRPGRGCLPGAGPGGRGRVARTQRPRRVVQVTLGSAAAVRAPCRLSGAACRRFTTIYMPEEEQARGAGRGLWQGPFRRPSDWRREHRRPQAGARCPGWLPPPAARGTLLTPAAVQVGASWSCAEARPGCVVCAHLAAERLIQTL